MTPDIAAEGRQLLEANRDRDTGLTMGSDAELAAWLWAHREELVRCAKESAIRSLPPEIQRLACPHGYLISECTKGCICEHGRVRARCPECPCDKCGVGQGVSSSGGSVSVNAPPSTQSKGER